MIRDADTLKIFVDRLQNGHTEKVQETVPSEQMEIHEEDLTFNEPIVIEGEAYIAQEDLVLHLNLMTHAIIPCRVCNDPQKVEVKNVNLYHVEPLENIKSGVYNFKEVMREAILLETPKFVECNNGQCPHRKEMDKYFKSESAKPDEDTYHPFADLE